MGWKQQPPWALGLLRGWIREDLFPWGREWCCEPYCKLSGLGKSHPSFSSWILPCRYIWFSTCETFGPGINCVGQKGAERKVLRSWVAQEVNIQTQERVVEAHSPLSAWTEDYRTASVVNLDKVCWQSRVLTGALHIQANKWELEGNVSACKLPWQTLCNEKYLSAFSCTPDLFTWTLSLLVNS